MNWKTFDAELKSTLKSEDTEGPFEIYVTRLSGYLWALLFKRLGIHPNVVTIVSIVLGALAGYMFYFEDLTHTLWGIFLLIWANWYDCADGQLARITNQRSLLGRILDGFAGDVWFFSIYFFISLRLTDQFGIWIWLLAAFSGFVCHSRQCALADYYRNIHIFFEKGAGKAELDSSEKQQKKLKNLSWKEHWFEKIYTFFYLRYTRSQEQMSPRFQELRHRLTQRWPDSKDIPTELRQEFRQLSRPLMKYTNILTFDLRVFVLFLSVLVSLPWIFFVFEVTLLNIVFFYMRWRHESLCRHILNKYLAR